MALLSSMSDIKTGALRFLTLTSRRASDSIGREGGVWPAAFLPTLRHGPAGTVAGFATVPGEGQDVSQAWPGPATACYQRRPEAAIKQY